MIDFAIFIFKKLPQIFAKIFEFTAPGFLSLMHIKSVCGMGGGEERQVFGIIRLFKNFEKLVPNFPSMNKSLVSNLPQMGHKFCNIINCSIFS